MKGMNSLRSKLSGMGSAKFSPTPPSRGKIGVGDVPDQAPPVNKAKALLAGVPLSVRGRKPRLGSL